MPADASEKKLIHHWAASRFSVTKNDRVGEAGIQGVGGGISMNKTVYNEYF